MGSNGYPQSAAFSLQCGEVLLTLGRPRGHQHDKVVQVVVNPMDAAPLQVPMQNIGHCIEYLGGGAEAEREHRVYKDVVSPPNCLEWSVIRVHRDESVGRLYVDFASRAPGPRLTATSATRSTVV